MWQLQDLRDVTVVLEHLRAHAEHQHTFAVDPANAALGLQIDVIDERRAVGVLDDDVRAREALSDVARAQVPAPEQVAAVVDPRRVGRERHQRIVHARQLRVFDLDEVGRRSRDLGRRGRDGDDGLALEAHAVAG